MITSTTATSSELPVGATRRRIFLVDDHPLFVLGLTKLIADTDDLEVCGHASSARKALSALRSVQAHLVIVDISLEGTNGLELIKHLQAEQPDLPILVMSIHDERQYAPRALRAGASGYVMKNAAAEELVPAVRRILEGQIALSPAYREQMIVDLVRDSPGTPIDALSDRELEVLQLVGEGHSTTDIAERLNLSAKTVESHRLHARDKLQLQNSTELVRFAIEWTGQRPVGDAAGAETVP